MFAVSFLAAILFQLVALGFPVEPPVSGQVDLEKLHFRDFGTGETRSVEQYKGEILILNFWATWCKPCLEEMPLLVSIQKRYAGRGVQVVAVSADEKETAGRIEPFLKEFKINFPVWVGGTTEHMERLGLGHALPATAIFHRTGQLMGRIIGQLREPDLTRYIDWLLEAPPDLITTLSQETVPDVDEHEPEHDHESHRHEEIGLEGASKVPS